MSPEDITAAGRQYLCVLHGGAMGWRHLAYRLAGKKNETSGVYIKKVTYYLLSNNNEGKVKGENKMKIDYRIDNRFKDITDDWIPSRIPPSHSTYAWG